MSTSATLQNTIQIRPSRFVGLLVAVAALTSVTTWAVDKVATSSDTPKPAAASSVFVDGVTAMSPQQQAAIYGNVPTDQQRADAVSRLSPEQQAAIYGNVPTDQQRADAVSRLSPEQQAAIYGNVPSDVQRADAVSRLSPTELAAIYGNVPLGSTP